jgi:hypothetical protein
MTAKPQMSEGAGARVGVPLARAKRLAERTASRPRRQRLPAILLGAAFAGLLAAGLLSSGPSDVPPPEDAFAAAVTDVAPVSREFADLAELPAPRPDLRARIFPCVERIEDRLRDLGGRAPGPDRPAALSALVQSTLDCPAATLEIEGSLELVAEGIASLRVGWGRDVSRLHLVVVDGGDLADDRPVLDADGLPLSFVVH